MNEIERLFEYQLKLNKNEKNPLIFYFICEFNNEPDRMEYEARSIQSFFRSDIQTFDVENLELVPPYTRPIPYFKKKND